MSVESVKKLSKTIKENIKTVIVGKDDVIDMVIVTMLCSGHVLLEDVPGLGKTMLARSLSKSVDSTFSRVQFTPDLMPSDLTGINFYNQKKSEFEFRKGPIMNQIVLADEINRATPRTQSSLLEVMAEHQVTVDGETYLLEEPFFVIATQNPIETGGTFPLPEAQLDRFFMQLSMGYPEMEEELDILRRFKSKNPIEEITSVVNSVEIVEARNIVKEVHVNDDIMQYIVKLVRSTRNHKDISLGISPRGSMALFRASQAYAAINGRDYVLPDDVKKLIVPIFRHRIILSAHATITEASVEEVIKDIVSRTTTPVEKIVKEI